MTICPGRPFRHAPASPVDRAKLDGVEALRTEIEFVVGTYRKAP